MNVAETNGEEELLPIGLGWFRFSSQLTRTRENSVANEPATKNGLIAFRCKKPNSIFLKKNLQTPER